MNVSEKLNLKLIYKFILIFLGQRRFRLSKKEAETTEEKQRRLEKSNERTRKSRNQLTPEEKRIQRKKDALRAKMLRNMIIEYV